MRHITIIRHAETEWSLSGKHTGLTDLPLNEKGKDQAALLQKCIQNIKFDHIFSSPLKRAHDTCTLAGLQPLILEDLLEWDYGDYEGMTREEIIKKDPTWDIFTHGAPNGESVDDVKARAHCLIEKLESLDGEIVLFSSGHISRAFTSQWLNLPMSAGSSLTLSTASISILGYEHQNRGLKLWNTTVGGLSCEI